MDLLTLDSLPEDLRDAIAFQYIAAGETLFRQTELASAFFIVETGRVKLVRYTGADKMVTFQIAGAGDSLAEIALFSDTYPCTAIAQVDSRVIVYPKEQLLSALRNNSDLADNFMAILTRQIQALKVRLELREIRSAGERVLQYLRYLTQPDTPTIVTFNHPLKDIAAELGLTPETLSRALARLETEGKITRVSRQIEILLHDSLAT
jgi:CRP/FNR family transcriptional regulator, dissimilatory nitrate respiration regulator